MNKLHKILACFGISVCLFLGFEQEEAKANIPIIDISNLLENILSYLQDADVAGLFDEISSYSMQLEEWKNKWEDFNKYVQAWELIQKGATFATEIIQLTRYYGNELGFLVRSSEYFLKAGAETSMIRAVGHCRNDFQSFFKSLTEETEAKAAFVEGLKNADALAILENLDKLLKEYKQELSSVSVHYRSEMYRLYGKQKKMEYALANNRWMHEKCYF